MEEEVTGKPWSRREVDAVVRVHLRMLRMQLLGQKPSKAEHNRPLADELPSRNAASIEYKHRNISAVLVDAGYPTLIGYKPLPNVQTLLYEAVADAVSADPVLDDAALRQVETPAEAPPLPNLGAFLVEPPRRKAPMIREKRLPWTSSNLMARDYLAREAGNRSLGLAGEVMILEFEARRLHAAGAKHLADRVEHVAKTQGDGAGFDILSFDVDGRDRFVEVKTTAYVAETPFFVSQNEVDFSSAKSDRYHLYRLFAFRDSPRLFMVPGALGVSFQLDPVSYRAQIRPGD